MGCSNLLIYMILQTTVYIQWQFTNKVNISLKILFSWRWQYRILVNNTVQNVSLLIYVFGLKTTEIKYISL